MRLFSGDRTGKLFFVFAMLLIAGCPYKAISQENQPILFHGIIMDANTQEPLPGVHYKVSGHGSGAADDRGMFSLYARYHDTIAFTCVGYRNYHITVEDTLKAKEYVAGIYLTVDTLMIPAVVVMPRLGNIKAEIMSERPVTNQEMINATNNLKISAYQGITAVSRLDNPASNYELLRQQLRIDAYEKGQIPSDKLISVSPFTLIPLIYLLVAGPPEDPDPPVPYISEREMKRLHAVHDSLIYGSPR